jgi:hypothetical protein
MTIKRVLELGHIYRQAGSAYLGHRGPDWQVAEIFTALDGLPHAVLVSLTDTSTRKTVALDALHNPRLYMVRP